MFSNKALIDCCRQCRLSVVYFDDEYLSWFDRFEEHREIASDRMDAFITFVLLIFDCASVNH